MQPFRTLAFCVLFAAAIPPGAAGDLNVGVFLRCTGTDDPAKAIETARALGFDRIQVSRLPDRFYTPEGAVEFAGMLKRAGLRAPMVVVVFDGESYRDRESVERTVGLRPAALVSDRVAYAKRCVDFAAGIGASIVTFHVGFLPGDPQDPIYQSMLNATREIAARANAKGVTVSLETGQETAAVLEGFLDRLRPARVGINFDTANLVLYGMDSPPTALKRLLPHVTSVHVKDGLPPADARALGRETRLGEGKAGVRDCLRILREAHFTGPVIIENYVWREAGTDPRDELRRAREFIG